MDDKFFTTITDDSSDPKENVDKILDCFIKATLAIFPETTPDDFAIIRLKLLVEVNKKMK